MPDPVQIIPGTWRRSSGYRHFFETHEDGSLCGAISRSSSASLRPGESVPPCQRCSQALAVLQDQPVTEAIEETALEVDRCPAEVRRFDRLAQMADGGNRFARVLVLAPDWRTAKIRRKGWVSSYPGGGPSAA